MSASDQCDHCEYVWDDVVSVGGRQLCVECLAKLAEFLHSELVDALSGALGRRPNPETFSRGESIKHAVARWEAREQQQHETALREERRQQYLKLKEEFEP